MIFCLLVVPEPCMYLRLGEIWKKWSDTICYLSIVILCVKLKNATPILVPHPKDDMHRPFEILLLLVYTEMRRKT